MGFGSPEFTEFLRDDRQHQPKIYLRFTKFPSNKAITLPVETLLLFGSGSRALLQGHTRVVLSVIFAMKYGKFGRSVE